ncbi:conserved protein [Tepidicaulis marinus]|uniref:Conserved protein n=1 Tax=Tepidicaulis marinus TaxID=1333998 RepID=A0A081BCX6_9HYPH|nr:translocation/assembly module TamB domain-containing protein [Tepidicaulis marinus]GAK45894.1 conserved protein [Tepidicaulis marinus]
MEWRADIARKTARWVGFSLLAVLVLCLLLAVLAYGALQTGWGKARLASMAEAALSDEGTAFRITGLEGHLPHSIRIQKIEAEDEAGVWLSAETVELDWNPLALLAGDISIERLHVGRMDLPRLPDAPEDAAVADGFSLPLPLLARLSLAEAEVEKLGLGPSVIGEAAILRLAAQTRREEGALHTALKAERLDGKADRFSWQSLYRLEEDYLEIVFNVDEPNGGLAAGALGLGEGAAFSASLIGKGLLSNWNGGFDMRAEGLFDLGADLRLREDEGPRFALEGKLSSPALREGELAALFGTEPGFYLTGTWSRRGALTLGTLRVKGKELNARFDGEADLTGGGIEGRVEADIADKDAASALLPGAEAARIGLSGDVTGELSFPALSSTLLLEEFRSGNFSAARIETQIVLKERGPLSTGASHRFSLVGKAEDVRVQEEGAPDIAGQLWRLAAEGTFDREKTAVDAQEISFEAPFVQLTGSAGYALREEEGRADLNFESGDLSPLAALAGTGLSGRGAGRLAARFEQGGAVLEAALDAGFEQLSLGAEIPDLLLSGKADVSAVLSRGPGRFSLSKLTLATPHVTFNASADKPERGAAAGNYALSLPEAGVLSGALGAKLSGPLQVEGTLAGSLEAPRLSGTAQLPFIEAGGVSVREGKIGFTAREVLRAPEGAVELSGDTSLGPLSGNFLYVLEDDVLALEELSLTSGRSRLSGAATVPLGGAPIEGNFTADVPALSPWLPLAGPGGSGALKADIALSGPRSGRSGQNARLKGQVTEFILTEAGDVLFEAARADLEVSAWNLMETPRFTGKVAVKTLEAGGARLETLTLAADGRFDAFAFDGSAKGRFRGPLALETSGKLTLQGNDTVLELETLAGHFAGKKLVLGAPARLARAPGAFRVEGLDMGYGTGRLKGGFTLGPRLDGTLSLSALPLGALDPFWATGDLRGTVSGTLSLAGTRARPSGSLQLRLDDLARAQEEEMPPSTIELLCDWEGNRLGTQLRFAQGEEALQPAGRGSLPLRMPAQGWLPEVPGNGRFEASLNWQGEIGTWWALVPLDAHRLKGQTQLRAQASGTPNRPKVTGSIRIDDGAYENLDTGTLITSLMLDAALEESRIEVKKLSGSDGEKGTFSASGAAEIAPESGFPFELDMSFSQFAAMRRDDITARASGEMDISGDTASAAVSGKIRTDGVLVRIPEQFPPEVAVLNVREAQSAADGEEERKETAFDLSLDIAVTMPKRVFVRGRGLDSEWEGALEVKGSGEEPRLTGELRLVRGFLSVLTKEFTLKSGLIAFQGNQPIAPRIDVVAEHRSDGLTVAAGAQGPASRPSISLSSVPSLPEEEIVSRVLFGKSRASLSALEAAQLAIAVGELTGVTGGGPGVLDFARGVLGADVLRVESGGAAEKGAAVEAGSYVSEDVYIGLKKGLTDNTGAVSVEVEVTPNISLRSETGVTGENDVGVEFNWDY